MLSDSDMARAVDPHLSLQLKTMHGHVPVRAAHPRLHLLHLSAFFQRLPSKLVEQRLFTTSEGRASVVSFLHSSFLWMLWFAPKPFSTSALPNFRPVVMLTMLANLSACSSRLGQVWPGQLFHCGLCNLGLGMATSCSGQPISESTFWNRFVAPVRMMARQVLYHCWRPDAALCFGLLQSMVRLEAVTL